MTLPPTLLSSRTDSLLHHLFDSELHAKTLLSLHGAVLGTLHCAQAGVALIGRGLAYARGLSIKHAVKQVDRLLSNPRLDPIELTPAWVTYVVAARSQIVVAFDWTEFALDGHSTVVLSMITKGGRATPLLWRSVPTEKIQRIAAEDELLERLRAAIPKQIRITLLADRGFGNQDCYSFLEALGIDYIIRFKESTSVSQGDGELKPAREYILKNGRANSILNAQVTTDRKKVAQVVCKHAKGCKQAWCLASSRADLLASEIVNLYANRQDHGATDRQQDGARGRHRKTAQRSYQSFGAGGSPGGPSGADVARRSRRDRRVFGGPSGADVTPQRRGPAPSSWRPCLGSEISLVGSVSCQPSGGSDGQRGLQAPPSQGAPRWPSPPGTRKDYRRCAALRRSGVGALGTGTAGGGPWSSSRGLRRPR